MEDAALHRELLAAFEAEYREHLLAIRAVLQAGPVADHGLRDVFRRAHSLKGAARTVELPAIEQVAHDLETLLVLAVEQDRALSEPEIATVQRGLDRIETAMQVPAMSGAHAAEPEPPVELDAAARIPARELDLLLDAVQELGEAVGDGTGEIGFLRQQHDVLRELASSCAADAAATSRISALLEANRARQRHCRLEAWRSAQALETLREQAARLALVSVDSVLGPLAAMTRDLARAQDHEVEVSLHGMALLVERQVLHALRDPVIHLLRNAVGHGMRPLPAQATPRIVLSASVRGGWLTISVVDDGPGPDLAAIAATARKRGLIQGPSEAAEAQLLSLVFEPGFSTAAAVDKLSGRGLGLSIVGEAAERLHGSAAMRPVRDAGGTIRGTRLEVSVPLPAQRQALLLVESGPHLLALPTARITRLLSVPRAHLETDGSVRTARIAPTQRLELRFLDALLGVPALPAADTLAVVVLDRIGLVVDRLHAVRTLVVRRPALIGIDAALVAGVAVIEGDRPVLVLEPTALGAAASSSPSVEAPVATDAPTGVVVVRKPPAPATILVVDDSLTTRTLEKTILQAHGYRVLVAVDGIEALGMLADVGQEIVLVVADVEMPRLDGFGLVAAMRADPSLRDIPTVLMTSRDRPEDRQRGMEAGASAYLTKQDFEQGVLLSVIGGLLR